MKFHSPMIIVADIDKSKAFYTQILQEDIQEDLETYVVFSGGFSLMTRKQWTRLTGDSATNTNPSHSFELYFEEDAIEAFAENLQNYPQVKIFTKLEEAPWGQQTLRILDPDNYVVEVSEPMEAVVKRLIQAGMTTREITEKSMMPAEFIDKCRADMTLSD